MSPHVQQSHLRPDFGVGVVPLRSAHRSKKHRVVGIQKASGFVSQRDPILVYGYSADVAVVKIEIMPERPAYGLQSAHTLVSNLRAYSVATQYGDIELHLVPPNRLKLNALND